jgi:predicted nuclease of predicted toxin-antitoxin system
VNVRFLLDENLSERLVVALNAQFSDTLHVRVLGLGGASDLVLWDIAARERCVLVTKDEDFVQLSVMRGPPPKVLWLNVGNTRTSEIAQLLLSNASAIAAFVEHPELGLLALGFGPRAI